MAFDHRVREELRGEVEGTKPDLERELALLQARSRTTSEARRTPMRRAGAGLAATARLLTVATIAAVIGVVIVLRVPGLLPSAGGGTTPVAAPSPSSSSSASPSPPDYLPITGKYSTTLAALNAAVSGSHLAGTWTITLERNGTMTVVPPPTFPDAVNGISGVSFSLDGDRFRTDLFFSDYCQSVGTYRWVVTGGRLTLTADGDTCAIRTTLLSTGPWHATP